MEITWVDRDVLKLLLQKRHSELMTNSSVESRLTFRVQKESDTAITLSEKPLMCEDVKAPSLHLSYPVSA